MADDWKARIEWVVREQFGGSRAKAARAMGVSGEQMRLYLKGSKPGPEVLASLLAKKPHISARYLLTGEGPRTVKPIDSDLYAAGQRDVARAVLRRLTALIAELESQYGPSARHEGEEPPAEDSLRAARLSGDAEHPSPAVEPGRRPGHAGAPRAQ